MNAPAAACGAHVEERLIPGTTKWLKIYSYFFEGEVYDYPYEVGSNWRTAQQAHAIAEREGCAMMAQDNFLSDVPLRTRH